MPIEIDFDKAKLFIKRSGAIFAEYKFKDLVTAKEFEPIVELQVYLKKIEDEKEKVSDEREKELDVEWFELVTTTGLVSPPTYSKAQEILTNLEMRTIASEVFIFLQNWSSIEEAKLFKKQLQEIQKSKPKR